MMTIRKRQETIGLLAPSTVTGSLSSKTRTWTGTKSTSLATVQPVSSSRVIAEYGERAKDMKQVYVPVGTTCDINYGVWLAGETDALPPWVIAGTPSEWATHTSFIIERRA